jgi:nucleoside phosphorylase
MEVAELLKLAIGRDAPLAMRAAEELKGRGAAETKRVFTAEWSVWPEPATTENFVRDAFSAFDDDFGHHLVSVLEGGTQQAVDLAVYAFPRSSLVPGGPGDRLYAWADRQVNPRLRDWDNLVSPMVAIGSAGLSAYASDVIKRADDKRARVCARTLVRMMVQAESTQEARDVLESMVALIAHAHSSRWPDRQFLFPRRRPTWPLTSPAIDVLVEHALRSNQPDEIRSFAVGALAEARENRIARDLIRRARSGTVQSSDAVEVLSWLGGAEAAAYVNDLAKEGEYRARVLPWTIEALDQATIEALKRDDRNRYLIVRAMGLARREVAWIEEVLGSVGYLERGYAGLGLAYARGPRARATLAAALSAVVGEGEEALRERILLNTALVHAGAVKHASELLSLLPRHDRFRDDSVKADILAALSIARGDNDPAVVAWRRVAYVPSHANRVLAPAKTPRRKTVRRAMASASVQRNRVKTATRTMHDAAQASPSSVDIGILTIKPEEFEAVLKVFRSGSDVHLGPSHRQYALRTADAGQGRIYRLAIVRHIEQGTGEAQTASRDLFEDLRPRLMLVVGIAGGVPSSDFTLGDVVISTRINDYTVEATKEGKGSEYAISGGPMASIIEGAVANLGARIADLGRWTKGLEDRPRVVIGAPRNFYGPRVWKQQVEKSLRGHFGRGRRGLPKFIAGVIGSSDRLVKDTGLLITWLTTARNLLAVEMESAGVYRSVRGRCPMLAIRGISDVVGFKRNEAWTLYACRSAAAFTKAFLRTRPIPIEERAAGASTAQRRPRRGRLRPARATVRSG